MFKELVDAIQNGVKVETLKIGDEQFTSRTIYRPPIVDLSERLVTATLQSIVDYFEHNIDGVSESPCCIHIVGPGSVRVLLDLDKENRRDVRVQAEYKNTTFEFGKKYDQTEFITRLLSQFVPTDDRRLLQGFVGGLTDDSSLRLEDDGISQKTVVKKGIQTLERAETGNGFVLAPYRTFSEVDQPESDFILRLHRVNDGVPLISLHESDNQAWKIEAINRIATWFQKNDVKVPILA
jgi:hypothetical protein